MAPGFQIVGERSTAKYYRPVSLLTVVSKVFEKLVEKLDDNWIEVWIIRRITVRSRDFIELSQRRNLRYLSFKHILLNNLGILHSLVMKFGQFM